MSTKPGPFNLGQSINEALALHQQGRLDEAEKIYIRVLKAQRDQFDALHLLGDDFTVADLNVAAVISRAIEMDLSATPNLKIWLTRCLQRPATREALALKTDADNATPVDVTRRIARINRL